MRLSEAIRLGAMLKPQGFEHLLKDGRSCAIGAAFEAASVPAGARDLDLASYFDAVRRDARIQCPTCFMCFVHADPPGSALAMAVTHLNDAHRWTRERIADWVEVLERADELRGSPASADAVREETGPPVVSSRA